MFNCINYEMIRWAIETAEEEGMPVLIGHYFGFETNMDPAIAELVTKHYAQKAKVPVALHLDHCPTTDICISRMKHFDSVMIDGSHYDFEENVRMTRQVVDIAHKMGIVVEAELGKVGNAGDINDVNNPDTYTDVKQAVEFVERTGCDSLAIAIGNAHGNYVAKPNLAFDRLKELRQALDLPLVLHGGSGIPDDQFSRCAAEGMSKFNIFTEYNMALSNAMKASLEEANKGGLKVLCDCKDACKELVRHKIRMLNPKGLRVV
ncbi:MAG: ketose-bisphosphate aldolase, partial [Candidatus Spyradocola sp.]